jgi:hypothetical protein
MSKPLTPDQSIINAMMARFKAITAGTDYYTTFGNNVFDNKKDPFDASQMPGINLHERNTDPQIDNSQTKHTCTMSIDIDIVMLEEVDDTAIRQAAADVLKSIGSDVTWSGLAFNTHHTNTTSDVQNQQGDVVANRRITIEIIYRKNAWSIA